ncbi:hypothetical protein V6N13_095286 [Hibiscus sabdariffa]
MSVKVSRALVDGRGLASSFQRILKSQITGTVSLQRVDLQLIESIVFVHNNQLQATSDAGSVSAAINSTSRSLPSTNQHNTGGNGPSTQ